MPHTKRERLVIKCGSNDVPVAFKVLATRLGVEYEETLKRLLDLEKNSPLKKLEKGQVIRL